MNSKTLTIILAAEISASAFGQGVILQNVGTGLGGTNGAVYIRSPGGIFLFDEINFNLGVEVWGGPNTASLQPVGLGTYTVATDPKGYTGSGLGTFQLGPPGVEVNIPGVASGGVATIRMDMWFDGVNGLFPSFYAALLGGGIPGSVTFLQTTGNPPLYPPPPLNGMPSVTLGPLPEPSTLALAGLGLALLLVFRHRK